MIVTGCGCKESSDGARYVCEACGATSGKDKTNPRGFRVPIMFSAEELADIDAFRHKSRIATRAAAVRELCRLGQRSKSLEIDLAMMTLERNNEKAEREARASERVSPGERIRDVYERWSQKSFATGLREALEEIFVEIENDAYERAAMAAETSFAKDAFKFALNDAAAASIRSLKHPEQG